MQVDSVLEGDINDASADEINRLHSLNRIEILITPNSIYLKKWSRKMKKINEETRIAHTLGIHQLARLQC